MNIVGEELRCARHPDRETVLRCGKCETPICTRCAVQTPVGFRCAECAQLRRLPQFNVGLWLLGRSFAGGSVASLFAWYVVSAIPYVRFFLSFLVGLTVGEVMTRLANRRSNRFLEVSAVVAIAGGLGVVEWLRFGIPPISQFALLSLILPAGIASWMAIAKLR